jgi:hypothetical protein
MRDGIHRRGLIKGVLATGATLALPTLARADDLSQNFARIFNSLPNSPPTPAAIPPMPSTTTGYSDKVVAIARRESARAGQSVIQRDVVAVADFARPSSLPRLHLVNLEAGTLRSFLVAHGRGSDPQGDGWLKYFSNTIGSEATSRGAYVVSDSYEGKYGSSLRLTGLDPDNSNAYDRAIVMHPAWYAAPDMLAKWGKLGRSEGCFAMDPEFFAIALATLTGGRLLFADRIEDV